MIFISFFTDSYSQFDANIKYGAHISSIITVGTINGLDAIKTPVTSHLIEASIGYDLNPVLNISAGLSYKKKGFGLEYTLEEKILGLTIPLGLRAELDIKSLSIPIKLKYKLPIVGLESYAFGGGGYSFHFDSKIKTSANIIGNIDIAEIPTNKLINKGEGFAHIGLGITSPFGKGKLFGEISYETSLLNYTSELILDLPIRNRGITVGVGYSMSF